MLFALAALVTLALPALADSSGTAFARGSSESEFSAQGVTPPAVKSIQEARRSLAGLEDDRSRMGRRPGFMPGLGSAGFTSPTPGATPPATPSVGASLADSMRRGLDTITVSVTPHVNAVTSTVIGSGGALQRRRTELQAEVARWGTANAANAASAAPAAPARASMGGGDPNMVSAGTIPGINPGDTVEVSVLEDPSTGGTFLVNTSGAIDLPGIGTVQILGQSEAGAADLIRQKLEGAVLVTATVAVRHIPQLRETRIGLSSPPAAEVYSIIYLAGEFITPGPLRIPADVSPTLLQTIIRSGGITPSGDLTRVKLLRIGGEVSAMEEINVAGILSGQMPPNDVALAPNDIIVIPLFAPVVYVTGNVERAGTLRLFQDETLTAYAAILRAGGFSRFANLRKCYVVRDLGNGEKMQIPVNVREVQKGKFPDVILQGKDIVVVPERFFSF
jgi:polysaccharide export outer membrane protein